MKTNDLSGMICGMIFLLFGAACIAIDGWRVVYIACLVLNVILFVLYAYSWERNKRHEASYSEPEKPNS